MRINIDINIDNSNLFKIENKNIFHHYIHLISLYVKMTNFN